MTRVGSQRHSKKIYIYIYVCVCVTLDILDPMMVRSEPKHVVGYNLK